MNESNKTKKALHLSILTTFVCIVMLIGTTFAWFTDTASTGVNKIQSGSLKIKLEYKNKNATDFTAADSETKILNENALWEPGYVEYAVLKLSNAGNLALKYKLGINIASETGSTNVSGESFKLSDYINFAVIDGDQSGLDRDALVAAAGEGTALNAGYTSDEGHLTAAGSDNSSQIVTLVVWMPSTVGNEANHASDADAPTIDLGVNVVATQDTVEYDSFNNTYDKDAAYPVVGKNELTEAIKNGGSILFGTDAETPSGLQMTNDTSMLLDGKTWTVGDNTKLANGADLSVKGGNVICKTYSGYVGVRPGSTTDSVVTYTDVNFTGLYNAGRETRGSSTTHTDYVLKYTPEAGGHTKFVFKNCTFTNSAIQFSGLSGNEGTFDAVFENCTFDALTNSSLIEVGSYLTDSTITIKNCKFNVTATSNFSIIDGNYGRAATVSFEGNNTFAGVVATPTGADKKGTSEEIKIFSENLNVKVCSAKTVNGLDAVNISGIVKK